MNKKIVDLARLFSFYVPRKNYIFKGLKNGDKPCYMFYKKPSLTTENTILLYYDRW